MTLQEAIAQRRSVRSYSDRPVPKDIIQQLLTAATRAPSAMNTQSWAFGVMEGKEQLQQMGDRARLALLAELDAKGVTGEFRDRLSDPEMKPFYGATALVVVYSTAQSPFSGINCALAAQNLMLCATDLGLGTCWIGIASPLFNARETKQELGVPEEFEAIAPIIVGYPAGETPEKEKNPPEVLFWR